MTGEGTGDLNRETTYQRKEEPNPLIPAWTRINHLQETLPGEYLALLANWDVLATVTYMTPICNIPVPGELCTPEMTKRVEEAFYPLGIAVSIVEDNTHTPIMTLFNPYAPEGDDPVDTKADEVLSITLIRSVWGDARNWAYILKRLGTPEVRASHERWYRALHPEPFTPIEDAGTLHRTLIQLAEDLPRPYKCILLHATLVAVVAGMHNEVLVFPPDEDKESAHLKELRDVLSPLGLKVSKPFDITGTTKRTCFSITNPAAGEIPQGPLADSEMRERAASLYAMLSVHGTLPHLQTHPDIRESAEEWNTLIKDRKRLSLGDPLLTGIHQIPVW